MFNKRQGSGPKPSYVGGWQEGSSSVTTTICKGKEEGRQQQQQQQRDKQASSLQAPWDGKPCNSYLWNFYFIFSSSSSTPCSPSQKPLPNSFPRMRWEKREERREKRREASKLATLERFLGRYSLSSLTLVARVSIDDTERVWPPDQSPNSSTTHKVPKSN